jgi:LysM repeat protein
MSSHRKPRLSAARNRARTVTLCAATISAAAMPVMAQAASSGGASSAVKPAQPPRAVQYTAAKPAKPSPTAAKATIETASSATSTSSTASSVSSSTAGGTGYTVVSGDTLSAIAERALGDGDDYHQLFKLNKDRVEPGGGKFTDADLIDVGWTIELPAGAKSAVVTAPVSTPSSSSSSSSGSSGSSDSDDSGSASESSSNSSTTASTASDSSSSSSSSTTSSSSSSGSSSSDSSGSSDPSDSSSSSTSYGDDLNGWIDEAISILGENGYSVSYDAVYETAINESDGDPDAENGWDSNAADGNPSEGLMQTTETTFEAYALAGYDDIWNPVDNIIAAAIYAQDAYGGLDVVVADRCGGSCWSGY